MRLKQNSSTAIVVKKSWANLEAIQVFLRERPKENPRNGRSAPPSPANGHAGQSAQSGDDSCTILVRVLDDTDERGLWIELNTKEHDEDPAVELQALMIPWHAVLAIVVGNDLSSRDSARAASDGQNRTSSARSSQLEARSSITSSHRN